MLPKSNRPPLDLGPMTGPKEYIWARSKELVRTFEALLDAEIELRHDSGGWTDCHKIIAAPLDTDPEAYLVVEHELSHWLFETDLPMTTSFVNYTAQRLLGKAGIKPNTAAAAPYEKHLQKILHSLWNILEDWRCCWLWGELYAGGADLLSTRWHDICEFDRPEKAATKSLLDFLVRYASGVETPAAPQDFQDCRDPMRRALNLVEGVGPAACLGITGILIDEIMDALLANNPPPPPPQKSKGGGGGGSGQRRRGQPPKKHPGTARKEKQQKGALAGLQKLCSAVPRKGLGSDTTKPGGVNGMGQQDIRSPNKRQTGSTGLGKIKRIINANNEDVDDTGMTPFQFLLHAEADRMQARLEQARLAMMRNHDTPDQERSQLILGAARLCGIEVVQIDPVRDLPPPTEVAYENRRVLEQLRMRKRRRKSYEGDFQAGAFIDAFCMGNLDRPFHIRKFRVPQFELLFLFDVSGSMTIGQALPLTERALADSVFAVQAIKSKSHMWAFSDRLYVFRDVGSVHVPAIQHGCTSMVQALDVAQRWAKRDVQKRALMLVTDGWPTSCRATNSTGDPIKDLRNVLEEIRKDKIPLSVLGIRNPAQSVEDAAAMYDTAFGADRYGMVGTFDDMSRELPKAVRVLAEAHVAKGTRRR